MTLDYLAGLIDGEGHLKFARGDGRFSETWRKTELRIAMTTLEPISTAQATFGGRLYGPYEKRTQPNSKPFYIWAVSRRDVLLPLLKELAPRLYLKRQEAEDIINYLEAHEPNRKQGTSVKALA